MLCTEYFQKLCPPELFTHIISFAPRWVEPSCASRPVLFCALFFLPLLNCVFYLIGQRTVESFFVSVEVMLSWWCVKPIEYGIISTLNYAKDLKFIASFQLGAIGNVAYGVSGMGHEGYSWDYLESATLNKRPLSRVSITLPQFTIILRYFP